MKTLVAGWFSFDRGGATAGDLLACELACEWLESAGCSYDIALAPPFFDGVNWRLVDPKSYSQVLFVCGPFRRNMGEKEFLKHFSGSRLIGLNVSMPIPLGEWNPFDPLFERDSSRDTRADMTFLSRQRKVPVVGVCLVEPDIGVAWNGYAYRGDMDAVANAAIQRLVESREVSVVLIDTRLDANITGLRTPAEVESLIARMDMVITTRLHGTVFALKNGVPAIIIEVDPRGAKIRRQMEKIGWPVVFIADALNDALLQQAFDYCLTEGARIKAKECSESAKTALQELRYKFIMEMRCPSGIAAIDPSDTSIATVDRWTPRIRYTNRTRFSLETYPHTYKLPDKESVNNEVGPFQLRVAGGNVAKLVFPTKDLVRIAIEKAEAPKSFDIQLNQPRLRVKAAHRYLLYFKARADSPRTISAGFAKAEAPWSGLGLYITIELTSEWQIFEEEFVALSDEDNARILFDVGNSPIPVELSSVSLRSVPDGECIKPDLPLDETREMGCSQTSSEGTSNHRPELIREQGAVGGQSEKRVAEVDEMQFGMLRRLTPISRDWGWDRGLPIDRYYIENFLAREAAHIWGHVLEIGDNSYTVRFGGSNVEKSDVLHVTEGNPMATIVADLTAAPHIPSDTFDCILLIQTLQLIYDVRSAIHTLYRILKPGGILLATFPGISQTYDRTWGNHWCWNFTPLSAQRLFQEAFPDAHVKIESFGNVLAAISFLHGLAKEELRQEELDYYEPGYEVTIAVKAMKPLGPS